MAETVGYKEWDAVCEALGSGRQCVLLRKGGIHEGRAGFSFKHERFFLFPTRFHAQAGQLHLPSDYPVDPGTGEWAEGDEVAIRFWCEAVWAKTFTDWETVQELAPFHVWREDLVRERFDCGEVQQIHCALVRVFVLRERWVIPYEKKFGGCRTWLELPDSGLPRDALAPVIPDDEAAVKRAAIEAIAGSE